MQVCSLSGDAVASVASVGAMTVGQAKVEIERQAGIPIDVLSLICGSKVLQDNDELSQCVVDAGSNLVAVHSHEIPFSSLDELPKRQYVQVLNNETRVCQACSACGDFDSKIVSKLIGRAVFHLKHDPRDGTVNCRANCRAESADVSRNVWLPLGALCPVSFTGLCRAGLHAEVERVWADGAVLVGREAADAAAYWWFFQDDEMAACRIWETVIRSYALEPRLELLRKQARLVAGPKYFAKYGNSSHWSPGLSRLHAILDAFRIRLPPDDSWVESVVDAFLSLYESLCSEAQGSIGQTCSSVDWLLQKKAQDFSPALESIGQTHPSWDWLLQKKAQDLLAEALEEVYVGPRSSREEGQEVYVDVRKVWAALHFRASLQFPHATLLAKAWEAEQDAHRSHAILELGSSYDAWDTLIIPYCHSKSSNAMSVLWSSTMNPKWKNIWEIIGLWFGNWEIVKAKNANDWMKEAVCCAVPACWSSVKWPHLACTALKYGADVTDEIAYKIAVIIDHLEGRDQIPFGMRISSFDDIADAAVAETRDLCSRAVAEAEDNPALWLRGACEVRQLWERIGAQNPHWETIKYEIEDDIDAS